jgi:hypothetical protein
MTEQEKAMRPEDITRLFAERSYAGDAAGVAALYEENAVLAYPPGRQTTGRAAIRALWEQVLAGRRSGRSGSRCWPAGRTSSRNCHCRRWSAATSRSPRHRPGTARAPELR